MVRDEIWMNGIVFSQRHMVILGMLERLHPSLHQTILHDGYLPNLKVFTGKEIENISRSVQSYVCLVSTFQFQVRSNIEDNSAAPVDAQKVYRARLIR